MECFEMEQLNSPLNNDELAKIDIFIDENINEISELSFEYFENIRLFQPKIKNFEEYLSQLTVNEKTRAWFYLFSNAKKKRKPRALKVIYAEPSRKFEIQEPKKRSPYVLIGIIFLCAVILGGVLYATKNNDVVSTENNDVVSTENNDVVSIKSNESSALPKPISENPYWNYTKSDFPRYFEQWGESGVKKISEIERLAVHKIANTQNSCDRISMVGLSENKSIPNEKIVVFVDCDNSERFYLSDSDLSTDTNIKSQTEKAISQSDAYDQCVEMVKLNAKYPSTVNFKMLDSNGFTAKTTGNVVINIGFEAKNSFGANLPAKARCVFTPDGEKEINITEN